MTPNKVRLIEAEAKRFLAKIAVWKAAQATYESNGHTFHVHTPKQGGAVRRASMDLTRALAEFRKP